MKGFRSLISAKDILLHNNRANIRIITTSFISNSKNPYDLHLHQFTSVNLTTETSNEEQTSESYLSREWGRLPEEKDSDVLPPSEPIAIPHTQALTNKPVVGTEGSHGFVMRNKRGKTKDKWICMICGHCEAKWWGTCRGCNSAATMKLVTDEEYDSLIVNGGCSNFSDGGVNHSWISIKRAETNPMRLVDVYQRVNKSDWRIPLTGLFGAEISKVLGGGIVPGSLVLVGGDPGIGKSTLLLQVAAMIAEGCGQKPAPVLYVSGEESIEQIGSRAGRMNIHTTDLYLYSGTNIEEIFAKTKLISPRALIIDSIQTIYLRGITGTAGSPMQVRECTALFLQFAKATNIPVLLNGHVTKTGDIAGPRVMEHIVDVVLYLEGDKNSSHRLLRSAKNRFGSTEEGDKNSSHRLLRSAKNRFGSTEELGVFQMTRSGLHGIKNPSQMFLSEPQTDSDILVGMAVAVALDGSRTFLVEVQALCPVPAAGKQVNGIKAGRAELIMAVLLKQAGLTIESTGVILNVLGGFTLSETASDLAIAAAIFSSALEFALPRNIAFIGEIGLGGELRMVPMMAKRVGTLAKLGYKKCVVPAQAAKFMGDVEMGAMTLVGCTNVKDFIKTIFVNHNLV